MKNGTITEILHLFSCPLWGAATTQTSKFAYFQRIFQYKFAYFRIFHGNKFAYFQYHSYLCTA